MTQIIRTLLKKIVKDKRLSKLTQFQNILILEPVEDYILRSITLYQSKYESNTVQIVCSYNPLFLYHDDFTLSFSKTLNLNSKTNLTGWNINDEESILNAISEKGIPFLSIAPNASEFLNNIDKLCQDHRLEEGIICSLVWCGHLPEATLRLKLFHMRHFFYHGKDELKARLKLLDIAISKKNTDELLETWIKQSIVNMNLQGIETFCKRPFTNS